MYLDSIFLVFFHVKLIVTQSLIYLIGLELLLVLLLKANTRIITINQPALGMTEISWLCTLKQKEWKLGYNWKKGVHRDVAYWCTKNAKKLHVHVEILTIP